jgi:hypothetical protein
MKRRHFLALASAAALPAHAAEPASPEPAPRDWWPDVKEVRTFTATSPDGVLQLKVALAPPDDATAKNDAPQRDMKLTRFDLSWDDKPVPIPRRLWSDLTGFRLQAVKVDESKLTENETLELLQFSRGLERPRLVVSPADNTALIEWQRPEEGGTNAMVRWMVSRGGTVLRHQEPPEGGC